MNATWGHCGVPSTQPSPKVTGCLKLQLLGFQGPTWDWSSQIENTYWKPTWTMSRQKTTKTLHTHTLLKKTVCAYTMIIYTYIYIWYMIYNWNPGKNTTTLPSHKPCCCRHFLSIPHFVLSIIGAVFNNKNDIAPRQNLGLDIVCVNNCTCLWLRVPNTSRIYMFELFWLKNEKNHVGLPQTFCSTSPSGPPKLRVRCTDVRPEEHNVRNKNLQVESTFQKVFTSAMSCKLPTKNYELINDEWLHDNWIIA